MDLQRDPPGWICKGILRGGSAKGSSGVDLQRDPPLPGVMGSGEIGGLAAGKIKAISARGSGEDQLRDGEHGCQLPRRLSRPPTEGWNGCLLPEGVD